MWKKITPRLCDEIIDQYAIINGQLQGFRYLGIFDEDTEGAIKRYDRCEDDIKTIENIFLNTHPDTARANTSVSQPASHNTSQAASVNRTVTFPNRSFGNPSNSRTNLATVQNQEVVREAQPESDLIKDILDEEIQRRNCLTDNEGYPDP